MTKPNNEARSAGQRRRHERARQEHARLVVEVATLREIIARMVATATGAIGR